MNKAIIDRVTKQALPTITRKINRRKLVLRKQAPHIFFGLGIAGSVTSTVLACRATLKLDQTLDEIGNDVRNIRELREDHMKMLEDGGSSRYTTREVNRDTAYVYVKAAGMLGRLYAPAITVGVASVAALTGSHVTMTRRNASLMAAYAAVSKAYDDYRARVVAELGEEKELEVYHAVTKYEKEGDGEIQTVADPNSWSPYARFFDEACPNWEKSSELNRLFVQCQQNYANEKLRAQGHLFLNEVYDMLGLDRSAAGAVVGWVIGDHGDNFVDFGMYHATNAQFINGWERSILLDFNVDGVIYDKI